MSFNAAATTALGAGLALLDPAVFVAVTATRSVCCTSSPVAVYVAPVAPPMSPQLAPVPSQRRHWYAYEIGWVPDHVPVDAVSACPACAVPEIIGASTFAGAVTGVWITSSGASASPCSRLAKDIGAGPALVNEKVTLPEAAISDVTSSVTQLPDPNDPESTELPDGAGALFQVIDCSFQLLDAKLTAKPLLSPFVE